GLRSRFQETALPRSAEAATAGPCPLVAQFLRTPADPNRRSANSGWDCCRDSRTGLRRTGPAPFRLYWRRPGAHLRGELRTAANKSIRPPPARAKDRDRKGTSLQEDR